MKSEQEAAIKLLDNSLKDKQEVINILREQLNQVKSINLDLVNEAQKNENEYKSREKEVLKYNGRIKSLEDENSSLFNK
jgi:hypothetical protein